MEIVGRYEKGPVLSGSYLGSCVLPRAQTISGRESNAFLMGCGGRGCSFETDPFIVERWALCIKIALADASETKTAPRRTSVNSDDSVSSSGYFKYYATWHATGLYLLLLQFSETSKFHEPLMCLIYALNSSSPCGSDKGRGRGGWSGRV